MPGLSSDTAIADAKYKLRHQYYEIYVAEIPPLAGFTGKELDVETSLYYFGARYYESWSGKWMSVDPLAKKYPGWGPYSYVSDNPERYVDELGLSNNDLNKKNQSPVISPLTNGATVAGQGFVTVSSSATEVALTSQSTNGGASLTVNNNAIPFLGLTATAAETYAHNPFTTLGTNWRTIRLCGKRNGSCSSQPWHASYELPT